MPSLDDTAKLSLIVDKLFGVIIGLIDINLGSVPNSYINKRNVVIDAIIVRLKGAKKK